MKKTSGAKRALLMASIAIAIANGFCTQAASAKIVGSVKVETTIEFPQNFHRVWSNQWKSAWLLCKTKYGKQIQSVELTGWTVNFNDVSATWKCRDTK